MKVSCGKCLKEFNFRSNLNKHSRKVHNVIDTSVEYDISVCSYKCLETGCNISFKNNSSLIKHLTALHDFKIENELKHFDNIQGKEY